MKPFQGFLAVASLCEQQVENQQHLLALFLALYRALYHDLCHFHVQEEHQEQRHDPFQAARILEALLAEQK